MKSFKQHIIEALKTKEIKASEFPDPLSKRLKAIFQTKGDMDGEEQDDIVQTKSKSWAASNLKPSQSAIFLGKSLGMAIGGVKGGDLGSIVSNDKHILDGHHRWAATLFSEPSAKIIGIEANLGIGDLVPVLRALGDSIGNQRRGEPAGGDVNIFKAKFQDVLDAIHDGKNMHPKFYDKDKAEAWLESIGGEDELKKRFAFIQKQTPPKGAPPRIEMPVIDADKGDEKLASKLLSKGKLDVREPYAVTEAIVDLYENSGGIFKGWVNVENGKVIHNKRSRPWHVQMIAMKPSDFGVTEKQIKGVIEHRLRTWGMWEKDEDVDTEYKKLKEGITDIDRSVELLAMNKGWHRFVMSDGYFAAVGSGTIKDLHRICVILEKEFDVFDELRTAYLSIRVARDKSSTKTKAVNKKTYDDIDPSTFNRWLKLGGDPNRLPKKDPKSPKRQDVTTARLVGKYPPGYDAWGPLKGRGGKGAAKLYAGKDHPFNSFREFINEQ